MVSTDQDLLVSASTEPLRVQTHHHRFVSTWRHSFAESVNGKKYSFCCFAFFVPNTLGPDKGAHYHELFLRGKRHLAHRIHRVKIKGSGARKPARPHEEPDFYKMPFLPSHASPSPPMTNPVAETITIPRTNNTTTLGNIDHPVMPNLYTQLLASAAGTSNVNNHHNSTIYYPLQSSSSSSVATSGMSLDQLLRQCPTWVPPSLAGSLPPHVLAALVKEGVDSATLWNQFRG